jgi:hypothetical protein
MLNEFTYGESGGPRTSILRNKVRKGDSLFFHRMIYGRRYITANYIVEAWRWWIGRIQTFLSPSRLNYLESFYIPTLTSPFFVSKILGPFCIALKYTNPPHPLQQAPILPPLLHFISGTHPHRFSFVRAAFDNKPISAKTGK